MADAVLTALFPHPLLAALLAVTAAVAAGTLGVQYATRRTLAQPVLMALAEETTVLAGVLTALRRYPYLATLEPIAFAAHHHHNIWAALQDVLGEQATYPDTATDDELAAAGAVLQPSAASIIAGVRHHLTTRSVSPATDLARLDELLAHGYGRGFDAPADAAESAQVDADVITAAESVLYAAGDRTDRGGSGLVVPGVDPNSLDPDRPPLVREATSPTRTRRAVAAAAGGVVGLLVPGFVTLSGLTGVAAVAAAVALLVLAAGSLILALVDVDTMFVDYRTWVVATAGSWAAAALAVTVAGEPGRLVYGVGLVVVIVVLLEGTNWLFRLLRGQHGQGFGDTLIVVLVAGVPPALVGDWRVGYWAVIAGTLAAAAGWLVARVAGRTRAGAAFAFGPWLACGWVLALLFYAYDTLAFGALR